MASPERYVCVHGHFYQPPRENAWLETVEIQDSAAPYHDWNERITAECYAPNGASRILNTEDKIVRIINNYSRISFNFGPTLLSWLKDKAGRTYQTIRDADRASQKRFGGHGSAMAQVYNHIIMPLANTRDRLTQIRWGIADFESRFGRKPEGMWLAETAVDKETLDLMAQEGIRFTVLAPHQCAHVRPLTKSDDGKPPEWVEMPNASVDTTQPYRIALNESRSIAVFFYNGPLSRAVAFEGLLDSGINFARRLLTGFRKDTTHAQLVHVATDGESYGHHHKHGEMALSYALQWLEQNSDARLTNYGDFLEKFPPTFEAEINEDSSWSCIHGVERWRSNCGCNSGRFEWNQKWRTPLRESLDWLRDVTAPLAEAVAKPLLKDLWAARDAYIRVILDRTAKSVQQFLDAHATHPLTPDERTRVLQLMELERHAQLMFTSCAWFFDEISGIETVQVISYAARVLQLAAALFGDNGVVLEAEFLTRLQEAKSNIPEQQDGAAIYRRYIRTEKIDLEQVGAHYAISSIFESYPEAGQLFCYDIHRKTSDVFSSGRGRIAIGQAEVSSKITEEREPVDYAVLHLGDQNLSAAVRRTNTQDASAFATLAQETRKAVDHADLPGVIRLFDRYFGDTAYSLSSLFRDEQRRILQSILDSTLTEMEELLRSLYQDHTSLMHFLSETGMPKPQALMLAAEFVLNADMRSVLEKEPFDATRLHELLAQAEIDQIPMNGQMLGYFASQRIKRAMDTVQSHTGNVTLLDATLEMAEALHALPFEVNFWQAQNIWNAMLHTAPTGEQPRQNAEWTEKFLELGRKFDLEVEQLTVED